MWSKKGLGSTLAGELESKKRSNLAEVKVALSLVQVNFLPEMGGSFNERYLMVLLNSSILCM